MLASFVLCKYQEDNRDLNSNVSRVTQRVENRLLSKFTKSRINALVQLLFQAHFGVNVQTNIKLKGLGEILVSCPGSLNLQ